MMAVAKERAAVAESAWLLAPAGRGSGAAGQALGACNMIGASRCYGFPGRERSTWIT